MVELSKAATRALKWAKPTIDIDEKDREELHHQFELGVGQALLRSNPRHVMALAMVGHAFTRIGAHDKALSIDRSLVALMPADPICHYNLACSLSNLGQVEDAISEIERAIDLGYEDVRFLEKDPDLANARKDPRFRRLMQKLKKVK
ncbi:MAG: hypothetical protein HZA54_20615 [Planctomycetes bacterium]|nr:hypothetical protein [Planctomycetota bacterium]